MRKFLLYGSNTSRIFTFDDVFDFFGQHQIFFINDFAVLDHIDSDIVVDEREYIQIQCVNVTFYFQNIFLAHLITAGILDDCHGTIQFI